MPRDLSMHKREWTLKRHSSLAPRQLALAYGGLLVLSLAVATGFGLRGYWWVALFSLLEMSAVTWAMLYHARHVADYEHISLIDDCLLIEQVRAGRTHQTQLDPYWTRIVPPRRSHDLIRFESKDVTISVGRWASEERRRQVAHELQQQLPGGWYRE